MKYRFYFRLKLQDENWVKIGEDHIIQWDVRDLIKASSGWQIINQEKVGSATDLVSKLRRGIIELREHPDTYLEYERQHGLGTIKNVIAFYESLLNDCQKYPFSELCGGVQD
jgi:hypothetical protein